MEIDRERLRRARLSRGLAQGELAKAAGVSLHTVWRAENQGRAFPATARKLAAALGVELDTLIDWSVEDAGAGDSPKARAA